MQVILLAGAGRMGSALLRGWIETMGAGYHFVALDPHAGPSLADIGAEPAPGSRFSHASTIRDLPSGLRPQVIVLATKPQSIGDVIADLRDRIDAETVLVSIAAGRSIRSISKAAGTGSPVIRVMPNIGASVARAVSAGFASTGTTSRQKTLVERLFTSVGQMTWLEKEEHLHLVTAVSGSGPAYYFAFCEAMIAAAEAEGLSSETARALAIGTVTSAGQLLACHPDPAHLRATVTSPNGTTAAGLASLLSHGVLEKLSRDTISAAARRSRELSQDPEKRGNCE
ncbi:pyrroline-5-carboxylate reductase [Paracoccus seriniphilus]|uniref:Pyrroline-5-carboxylate reductase n=1 Tax=Paracoccus seriniphilus TaxID=184748 RepID=A0A239Q2V0_9RHOB|nr:pyrroline-5-carboxylate reductase [Paracoccus seriniphilus]WCR16164.1 pyrroline-5-carboxylate reductase [Paracoccus seriniphilus]SNT76881.1 pyrroline-5-carboxylate reductase [Paracoccus seriniphilus]